MEDDADISMIEQVYLEAADFETVLEADGEAVDKIRGLGLGADDYIAKPFDPAELVARVNANLRQHDRGRTGPQGEAAAKLRKSGVRDTV